MGCRNYPRSAGLESFAWLHVGFLWLHSRAAAGMILPFDLLFTGQMLPTHSPSPPTSTLPCWSSRKRSYVVVVVVAFFTLTDRASTILSNIRGCQSGTWSRRGTKVNGSHHGDNPLLGPTGIQIAIKSYATLQAMAPTNNKTVHRISSFTPYRE